MIAYFINNPKIVLLISTALVFLGISGAMSMKKESYPSVELGKAKITTIYPGASPDDVESLVTQKIEDEFRSIGGIKEIRSVSQESVSEITVAVDINKEVIDDVLEDIRIALARVKFPKEVTQNSVMDIINTEKSPILEVSLVGGDSEQELRQAAESLKRRLEDAKGVGKIRKIGYLNREYKILIDPKKMAKYHVSFNEVVGAIRARNINMPGGIFESYPIQKTVRTIGEFKSADEILNVVVRSNLSSKIVRVGQVAEVVDGYERVRVLTKTNGEKSIILVAMKLASADAIATVKNIRFILEDFKKSLPASIKIIASNDEGRKTQDRIDVIFTNSIIGFCLMLLSLFIFLNLGTSIVTSISVPVIVLFTLTVMGWAGISFNIVSMLGIIIALGMFVDNSIVIAENIYRLREQGMSIKEAAIKGTQEIAAPITATVLTTIAAFLPMTVTKGMLGQFIWAIPIVVTIALIVSLGDSFFLLPSRIIAFSNKKKVMNRVNWFVHLERAFETVLRPMLRFRWLTMIVAFGGLAGSFYIAIQKLDFMLFPPEGVTRFAVRFEAEPGSPIEEIHAAASQLEKVLLTIPKNELEAVSTRTGFQQSNFEDPLAKVGPHVGIIFVYLTRESDRSRSAREIIKEVKAKIGVPAPFRVVQFEEIADRPPLGKPVTLRILGQDLPELLAHAADVKKEISKIPGVYDVEQDMKPGLAQIQIKMKDGVTGRTGLTVHDIAIAIRAAQEGLVASTVRLYGEDIDIRVLFDKKSRGDIKALNSLLVANRRGNLFPLEEIAHIDEVVGPSVRRHFNYHRSITVTAEVDRKVVTSFGANQQLKKIFKDFNLDNPGYELFFGGEEEKTMESMESLAEAMVIAALAIFGILVGLFKSFLKPFLIMLSIPFGFFGVILGFVLQSISIGFISLIGVIGLAGVVVNSAIVLIAFTDDLIATGKYGFHECLIKGSVTRLRPIVLTTLTTVIALIPTAYGIGGSDALLVPMTMAMAWGLSFGTLISLIVIPCGYGILQDIVPKFDQRKNESRDK